MYSKVSTVRFEFEVSYANHKSMSLLIETETGTEYFDQLPRGKFQHEISVQFPTKIKITVDGKTANDTIVDDAGNIIADTYFKLVDMSVDRMPCFIDYLHNQVLNLQSGEFVKSNYWGFNGTVEIDLPEENSFFWALTNSQ